MSNLILSKYEIECPLVPQDLFKVYGGNYVAHRIPFSKQKKIKIKQCLDILKHLKRIEDEHLLQIEDYGYDELQEEIIVVYYIKDKQLPQKFSSLGDEQMLRNLKDVAECLKKCREYNIYHGAISNDSFLIIDNKIIIEGFGLFCDGEDQNLFAKDLNDFAQLVNNYFPNTIALEELSWHKIISDLEQMCDSKKHNVLISFQEINDSNDEIENIINEQKEFEFSVKSPKPDTENLLMDIKLGKFMIKGVLWIKNGSRLHFLNNDLIPIEDKRKWDKLPISCSFNRWIPQDKSADLYEFFYEYAKKRKSLEDVKRSTDKELNFYKELLNKEIEVIEKNALRLRYERASMISKDEFSFIIKIDADTSSIGQVNKHVDEGNDPNFEGFEYKISPTGNIKNKEAFKFCGKPYYVGLKKSDEETALYEFKIKDCENIKYENIPQKGYLFEDTTQEEAEKNRQIEAIKKVEKNETTNPDLTYYLFNPEKLQGNFIDYNKPIDVKQKTDDGTSFTYSINQKKAIWNAIERQPLSVIQGPPGTGKTTVITEIVFQLLEMKKDAKILITSQTNNAVDQVLENLLRNNIPVLRLCGITQPRINVLKEHTMSKKIVGWKNQVRQNARLAFEKVKESVLQNLSEDDRRVIDLLFNLKQWSVTKQQIENRLGRMYEELSVLPDSEIDSVKKIGDVLHIDLIPLYEQFQIHSEWVSAIASLDEKSSINQKLIDSIRVIGATCNHVASKQYAKYDFQFDYVIMDESGKATTAEALVPIVMGKNLIFVGDHRQLPPMLTSTREVERWLREQYRKEDDAEYDGFDDYFNRPSLFEQVIENIDEDFKTQLTECRRSSKEQVELTSRWFYEECGDEKIVPVERDREKEHCIDAFDSSIIFIDTTSSFPHKKDSNSSSYNEKNAEIVVNVLEFLNKFDVVKNYSFGVITGYTAQSRKIKVAIDKKRNQRKINSITKWNKPEEKLTVSVIDRFQGLERDIIIVDLVKGGAGLDLGFLEKPNRINVALSRQKRLLILIGDYYGIVNTKTKHSNNEEKCALQKYLNDIRKEWIYNYEMFRSEASGDDAEEGPLKSPNMVINIKEDEDADSWI